MKICFWAYKGGTGRSLLLANMAVELANRGFNVGMIDIDYEAPGLHIIFNLDKDVIQANGHLVNLLLQKTSVKLNDFVVDLKSQINSKGNLYLLPSIDDVRFDDIEWDENLFIFMNNLLNDFTQFYQLNYLLIDTRTGFSTASNFGKNLADFVVISMRPNRQNVAGILGALKGFAIDQFENYIIACSEVPETSNTKKILRKIEDELQTKIKVTIPYSEKLAFGEKLLIIEEPTSIVSQAYKKLADFVVKQ